jgi:hypothetical protein
MIIGNLLGCQENDLTEMDSSSMTKMVVNLFEFLIIPENTKPENELPG